MAKTPSKKLFRLVKSLLGSERRYFKLAVNPAGDKSNKYTTLFDGIWEQEEFNDSVLQSLVYGNEPIESRKYSELKNYLYGQILKSLQGYDTNASVIYKVRNYLLNVKVLFKRSLFADCQEELKKAEKLANQYELFAEQLEILSWKKELAYSRTDITFLDKNLDLIAEKEIHFLECQRILVGLRNLFFKLLVELRKDVSRNKEQQKQLEQFSENPLLKEAEKYEYYYIEVMRLRFISLLHFAKSEIDEFYDSSKILVKKMEGYPHFLKEDVAEYISALNNHLIACGRTKKYQKVENYLGKMKDVKPITKDDELKIHRQYYVVMLRYCIEKGDFEKGLEVLLKHKKEVEKFPKFSFTKNSFFFQYFSIYFGLGDFEGALYYLNEWLNQPRNVERQDLQSLARILNLLTHYEMGNTILLHSLIRSTKRFLKKENRIYQFELKIMEFFIEMGKPLSKNEKKQITKLLQKQLDDLLLDPEEKRMMNLFNFSAWIESKASGDSFAKVVQNQFRKELAT